MCGISAEPLTYVNIFGKSNSVALAGAAHRGRFSSGGLATELIWQLKSGAKPDPETETEEEEETEAKGLRGRGRAKGVLHLVRVQVREGIGFECEYGFGFGFGFRFDVSENICLASLRVLSRSVGRSVGRVFYAN